MIDTIETKSPQLRAVLDNQQGAAAARLRISQLNHAVALQRAKAEQLRAAETAIAALEIDRQDLLADVAMGLDKATELSAMDERLAQKKKDAAEQGTHAAITQTLAGLNRKLDSAQAELTQLSESRNSLMRRLLIDRAEALGLEYVAAARHLRDLHAQMVALVRLIESHGGHVGLFLGQGSLQVPAFGFESVKPHAKPHKPLYVIDTTNGTQLETQPAIQAETEALRALGVEIG